MEHHPIFGKYRAYEGPRTAGEMIDMLGARFLGQWWGDYQFDASDHFSPGLPPLDEEYFEWADTMEAVSAASETFTMIELGAGYGRWGIRGAAAAAQRGLRCKIVFVEAEPQHAAWIGEAMAMNGVEGTVIEAAIAYDGKPVPFAISGPSLTAGNWYGQARMASDGEPTDQTYFGRTLYANDRWGQIMVPAVTLEAVMDGLGVVDFLDADLQGAEKEMILNSMPILSERVRRVHIGTHSAEIEDLCRSSFRAAGWRNVWDFTLQMTQATPYGECWFGDGISAWINPKLT